MKLIEFAIGVLLIGFIGTVGWSFMSELAAPQHYNVTLNESINATAFINMNNVVNETEPVYRNATSVAPDTSTSFFTGAWDAFKLGLKVVGSSVDFVYQFVGHLGTALGLPPYLSGFVTAIVSLLVIGALIFLLIRRQP